MINNKKRLINLIIGPILLILCSVLLPRSIFESYSSRVAIGTVAWMSYWWVTGPVDYAVTAFLPIALNALFQVTDMNSVIANYASETILLLLGASILTVSWEKTGLDMRIAAAFLRFVGSGFRVQLIFWFLLSMTLSAVLPNSVVCATVTPIAVSMLTYIGEGDIRNSRIGSKLLLTIVYATGLGGLASPLGGAMNLVTVDYIQQITGREYMYTSWVVRFFPIMIVLAVSNILFIIRDVNKGETLGGTKEYFIEQYKALPKMTFEEKASLFLFAVATILSFTRQLYQDYLPGLKPAYVFIICAIISFFIYDNQGKRLMIWKSVQTKIVWELIYIFAGGLAAGTMIKESGVANAIGMMVSEMKLTSGVIIIIVILTMTLLLSDVTSNTATAAVAIPVVISVVQGIGQNPIPFIYIASVGVNLSYMLPTSIRAIPVGYGLEPKYMLKEGWKITLMVIILMTFLCSMMYYFWPDFSGV